ncbi:hypothetical protein CARUB_v100165240mg, partial [Capsella rubella]
LRKRFKELAKKINDLCGIKDSDTGLARPSQWDLVSDKQMMQEEQPLQIARCTKIIMPNTEDAKYVISVNQIAKEYLVLLVPEDKSQKPSVAIIKMEACCFWVCLLIWTCYSRDTRLWYV